jgi:hypothetical protein
MRYLVQRETVALFAVILGLFADCSSSLTTFWEGEAGIAVTALLDQKGDMLLGSGESLRRNSLAVIFRRDKRCRRLWFWLNCLPNRNYQRVVGKWDW